MEAYVLTSGTFVVVAVRPFALLLEGTGFEIVQTNHSAIVETYAIFCNNSFQIARNISSLITSGNTNAFSKQHCLIYAHRKILFI